MTQTYPTSMNCEEVVSRLWLYLDDACDQTVKEEIELHLEDCVNCVHQLGLHNRFLSLIHHRLGGQEPSDRFVQRLRDQLLEVDTQTDT